MEITANGLRASLTYDPVSGAFHWKNRPDISPTNRSRLKGMIAGGLCKDGYIKIKINDRLYSAHRLAWLYVTGVFPKGEIDHKDGDRKNNSWANLREATRDQNQHNRKLQKNNTSGYKGVSRCWDKRYKTKIWIATIRNNGKQLTLGRYKTPQEAHKAYCYFAEKTRGEFARG